MLRIIEDHTRTDGTVTVMSTVTLDQEKSDNIFQIDYEDYLLLKLHHFYKHRNGSFITRMENRQYNLNRILAWKRGYFDLAKHPKIVVKFADGDKTNFTKINLLYYFTDECVASQTLQTLPRGVYYQEYGRSKKYDNKFFVRIPACGDLVRVGKFLDTQVDAILHYQQYMKQMHREDWKKWL